MNPRIRPTSSAELLQLLRTEWEAAAQLSLEPNLPQPTLSVGNLEQLIPFMAFLRNDPRLYFDLLESVSGVDYLGRRPTLGVVYHLSSIPFGHRLVVKAEVPRAVAESAGCRPVMPSLGHLWRTADWHEREVFDLFGIHFENHPDLRRMFLPHDWQGHPLRKDYETQETYGGILVGYHGREEAEKKP